MSRPICPNCQHINCFQEYDNGGWCFRCHYITSRHSFERVTNSRKEYLLGPYETELTWQQEAWLHSIFGHKTEIVKHLYKFKNCGGKLVLHFKGGTLLKRIHPGDGPKNLLFYEHNPTVFHMQKNTTLFSYETLVLTEDVFSAMKVNTISPAAAILGCKLDKGGEKLAQIKQILSTYKHPKVIIWLDNDPAGWMGAKYLENKFGLLYPTYVIRSKKDPKNHTYEEIEEYLNDAIRSGFASTEAVFGKKEI